MSHDYHPEFCTNDVHNAFGLTYGNYLCVPRVLMQEMPAEWQHDFTALMGQFHEAFPGPGADGDYMVKRRENGKFVPDPLSNYRHPDAAAIERARKAR